MGKKEKHSNKTQAKQKKSRLFYPYPFSFPMAEGSVSVNAALHEETLVLRVLPRQ